MRIYEYEWPLAYRITVKVYVTYQFPVGGRIGPPGLTPGPGRGINVEEGSVVVTAVRDETLRPSKKPWIGPVGGFKVGSWITLNITFKCTVQRKAR